MLESNLMKKKLLIIKFGGSVVTFKDSLVPKARTTVVKRLAKEIKHLSSLGYQLILVHGAGSYGHPLAKKYQLHKGMKTEQQKLGLALTQKKMLELNDLIVSALHQQKVPAVILVPHSFITQSSAKFSGFDYSVIQDFLKQNLVPVLYGDGVLDNKWGCSILSGDTIVTYLAQKLKADRVIFLSDVDGIFDKDPKKYPDAKLIKKVNDKNLMQVLSGLTTNNIADVTGEMQGKILSIKSRLKGIQAIATNGLKRNYLVNSVGSNQNATVLHFD